MNWVMVILAVLLAGGTAFAFGSEKLVATENEKLKDLKQKEEN